jgi:signal recognition particle subunit SEC65
MKEHRIEQTLNALQNELNMTAQEKQRVFNVIQEHIEVNNPALEPKLFSSSATPSFGVWFARVGAVAFMLVAVIGSGMVAAADQALPGEALYGFKISVNEEIQSFLQPNSPAVQLAYEAQRTQDRIKEAQTLIEQGRFDEKAQEDVARSLEKHSKEIDKQVKKVAAEEPEKFEAVSNEIKEKIATSTSTLALAASQDSEATASVKNVLAVADTTTASIESAAETAGIETQEPVDPALPTHTDPEYLAFILKDVTTRATTIMKEVDADKTSEDALPAEQDPSLETQAKTPSETETPSDTGEETPEKEALNTEKLASLLENLKETYTTWEEAIATEEENRSDRLATKFLNIAQEVYDIIEVPRPTLADVFGEDALKQPEEIDRNTNGVIPIMVEPEIIEGTVTPEIETSEELPQEEATSPDELSTGAKTEFA